MVNFFTFGGVSSRAFNLYITGDRVHSGPERDIERVSVPGRDGDLIIDNGRWKNYQLPVPCFYRALRGDVGAYARKIKAWLLAEPAAYRRLEFSYDPDYFRMAAFTGPLDIDTSIRMFGKMEIAFDCKPFKWLKRGQELRDITSTRQIINPEACNSLPYIKMTGSGDIRLTVADRSWNFAGVNGWIEIDSDAMNTYRGTEPQNGKKTGDGYPALLPGVNRFAWEGNVTKVEVIPKWRTL